jgi:nitroreductase
VDFQDVLRRRRMERSFSDAPVADELVNRVLANAQRAPSAGFTEGWEFVVLVGPEETAVFWDAIGDAAWRAAPDWPGLLRAPVIVVPLTNEALYRARYAEPDKARGMVHDVPYWLVDTSFATMVLLLSAVDAGLGAAFFGLRGRDDALLTALAVPAGLRPLGAVALGWPDGQDRPSASVARGHRSFASVVHRGRW